MLIAEYVVLRHHRPARARNDDDFAPVLAAAWRADPASAADVDTVREIVRRWVEGSGGVTSSLVRKEAVSLLELFSLRATDVLTPDERLQLKERRFRGAQALRTDRAKPSWHPVALLSAVPHGLAGSLRAASGCRAEKRHDRIVEATYRPDGRPQAVSIPTGASRLPLPEGCVAMVEALTSLAYEPAGPPYPGTRVMFVRLDEAFTQCHDQPYPVRGTAEAAPPDTTSEVDKWERLTYPPKSVFRKDTGVVQVDAVVSPAGCVMAAWVRGPVTLELDAAALDGLSRAILSPARATGRRVPERIRMFAAFWNE